MQDIVWAEAIGRYYAWAKTRLPLDRWQLEIERNRAELIKDLNTIRVIEEKIAHEPFRRAA